MSQINVNHFIVIYVEKPKKKKKIRFFMVERIFYFDHSIRIMMISNVLIVVCLYIYSKQKFGQRI